MYRRAGNRDIGMPRNVDQPIRDRFGGDDFHVGLVEKAGQHVMVIIIVVHQKLISSGSQPFDGLFSVGVFIVSIYQETNFQA